MSAIMNWIVTLSFLALATLLFRRDYQARSWKKFGLHVFILLATLEFLRQFGDFLTDTPVARGDSDEMYVIATLYAFVLLGMFASYAYKHFAIEVHERKQWDFGLFIAPLFVSPIIFMPLLAALQRADGSSPRMMMFFVAFQNGFLWKEYFDKKKEKVSATIAEL